MKFCWVNLESEYLKPVRRRPPCRVGVMASRADVFKTASRDDNKARPSALISISLQADDVCLTLETICYTATTMLFCWTNWGLITSWQEADLVVSTL